MAEGEGSEVHRHLGSGSEQGAFDELDRETQSEAHKQGGTLAKRPSTRRRRDYSKQTTWTYELCESLYKCYLEADKSVYGYSQRKKDLWDKAQPDYKHLTAKHLTTQVTRILNKGLIYETRFNITTEDSEAIVGTQEVSENDNMERKENTVERDETESMKQEINHNKEAEGNETDVNDKNPKDEISNKRIDETAVLEMVELIRPTWRENF